MNRKISDSTSTSTSTVRRAHLSLAPEPGSIPEPDESPEARAYRAGREDALAGAVDLRYRALAGLDRLESMDIEELDALAGVVAGVVATKRLERPGLRLVTEDDAATGLDALAAGNRLAETALANITRAATDPAFRDGLLAGHLGAGRVSTVPKALAAIAAVQRHATGDAS